MSKAKELLIRYSALCESDGKSLDDMTKDELIELRDKISKIPFMSPSDMREFKDVVGILYRKFKVKYNQDDDEKPIAGKWKTTKRVTNFSRKRN